MRRILPIIALMIISVTNAFAQEKKHVIEITTGYPSLVFSAEFPWSHMIFDNYPSQGIQVGKKYYQPGLNVGYTYSWNKRWEVNAMVNIHLTMFELIQYPLRPDADSVSPDSHPSNRYDWNAEPLSTTLQTDVYGSFNAAIRYKWLVRNNFSMYSALGVGISLGFPIPLPYVAPIGIKFGKGKVYGIVEANASPATTFGMAGIGIKL